MNIKKEIILFFAAFFAVFFIWSVQAHGAQDINSVRAEERKNIKEESQASREAIRQQRVEMAEQFRAQRNEAQADIRQKREDLKEEIQTKRERVRDIISQQREELRSRLETIKDERKKQIVGRIYDKLNVINERWTDHLLSKIDQIEDVLDRVMARRDKAQANGLDVSAVNSAITEAQNAIVRARTVVQAQAGKTYTVPVGGEATLRDIAKNVRRQLHDDLVAARNTVKNAHDAVRKAAVALAQIPRVDEVEIEDSSNNTTGASTTQEVAQ